MFKEATAANITIVKTVTAFADKPDEKVIRGKYGAQNVMKVPGCVIMPDFDIITEFNEERGELTKKLSFINSFFIISAQDKEAPDAEDAALDLFEAVNTKVINNEISIGGNYYHWEPYRIEFMERSSSGTVINVDYKINIPLL